MSFFSYLLGAIFKEFDIARIDPDPKALVN
jgi:hypothetical protein